MRQRPMVPLFCLVLCLPLTLWAAQFDAQRGAAMVSSDHRQASEAGAAILALGGNAVDAAVATALAAGVVQPAGSGLGGGGFAVYSHQGRLSSLDFRERASLSAPADLYFDEAGHLDPMASRIGARAVGVPGEGRGLAQLLAKYGRLSPSRVAQPAIALASRGFALGTHLARALERGDGAMGSLLFRSHSGALSAGIVVRRPDLAGVLKRWARSGGESLYTGPDAARIVRTLSAQGGVLTADDFAQYEPRDRAVLRGRFGQWTVVGMGPPSSGGLALIQMLGMLESFDLKTMGHNSTAYVHLLTEVMKHVYADRAHFLGDPDFVTVPVKHLLDADRIEEKAHLISPTHTFSSEYYGSLIQPSQDHGTQHISVIDRDGDAVALTTTINTSFGSRVVPEGLGFPLNNEMDDFSLAPGAPNTYGLVGSAANAMAPGKRPLSSMTPTLILDETGEVQMAIGGSGGSTIISAVLQVFLNQVVFGMDPQEAVGRPRFHHQWLPNTLFLEPEFSVDTVIGLEALGHTVVQRPGFSSVQVVARTSDGQWAGADPRKGGWPAASGR